MILQGDCFAEMLKMESASVDCVLTDLPYGTTDNRWDSCLPLDALWAAWRRLLRPGGPVILFTQQPFTTKVAVSNLKFLRTEWIWRKPQGTGFLNASRYPLKNHENILVFCDRMPRYWPQKCGGGGPYMSKRKANSSTNYSSHRDTISINRDGTRFPVTVLDIPKRRSDRGSHPTQKPLELLEYLIRTYTTSGQTILDCCAGSGSTVVAAINTGRRGIGIESDKHYCAIARERIATAQAHMDSGGRP